MKNFLLALTCILLLVPMSISAAKTVYIPSTWVYNSSTQEYTENGNSDLQWSYNRSKQSDNCIVFWQKGFGTDPTTGSITFDPDAVLSVAEAAYAKNVNELGFSCSNMLNKYKLMILVSYTNDWVCYGGGYDFEVSALWIGPSAVNPAGHSLAHEVGHSFHYMCYAEAANYSHTSSSSINTGFHLACGNGQAIWEQTAQWQANQSYPGEMFYQSYPLFGNNANMAFSHEWMRYQSYWFHYYLSDYYNDKTIVSQIWKQPMTGQSNGNATDFCQAYIALKGLSASQFYERYFDYALKCATFDFTEAANYRNNYVGNFDYYCAKLGEKQYQVAYHSAPQSTGFNVIELDVPSSGTTVTTAFKALTHGCALNAKDPATYNNGVGNASVNAGVDNYNSAGTASYRGFRVGYVFLKSDGTRSYYNDNTVHCTGTAEKTENISTTVPANTSRMFLVVTPALTNYVRHPWDDDITNDDQWPYSFTLTGTDLKTKSQTVIYTEEIPDEPEFTKQIDGRSIADVTLSYNVILPPSSDYTGAGVTINAGNAVNALCTAFQLESSEIFNASKLVDYTASQSNNTIMSCALTSAGAVQAKAKNTNGTFGHWFNSSGTVTNWGDNSVAFTEINDTYTTCTVGQMPSANSNGNTRTIREGLVYKNSSGKTATATIVFNITFKTGATPTAYLSAIDYTEPAVEPASTTSITVTRASEISLSLTVVQGESASHTLTSTEVSSLRYGLNNITESYLTNSNYFMGYNASVASQSSGNNVYYFALSQAATTSTNGFKFYQTKSVTTDTDFDSNHYTHYYLADGSVISADNANHAAFKVAYDYSTKKFVVKVSNSCPTGTYTVYLAMARRSKSGSRTYTYSSYFPITITVEPSTIPEYTYNWTLTSEEFASTNVELKRVNYDTEMGTFFQTNLGLTTDQVQTKLSEMGTYNQTNNGVFTVGYAGGNVPSGYLAYYPLDANGNVVTTNSTTFNDYGWWFNASGAPCTNDGTNNVLAMCLDWIGHAWVLQQNVGALQAETTYPMGVMLIYNDGGTMKRCKIFFNITTPEPPAPEPIKDVTITYNMTLAPSSTGYEGIQYTINGTDQAKILEGFRLSSWSDLQSKFTAWTTDGPTNGQIMPYPVAADGVTLLNAGSTANGDWGYWYNKSGVSGGWNDNSSIYVEFDLGTPYFSYGQYPGHCADGDTYDCRQALKYVDDEGNVAIAYIVFNVTFATGATNSLSVASVADGQPAAKVAEPVVFTYNVEIHPQTTMTESFGVPITSTEVDSYGVTWDALKAYIQTTHDNNSNSIGVANHTLAANEVMIYPANAAGEAQTATALTYSGIGMGHSYGTTDYTTVASLDAGSIAVGLDWVGSRWVIHQKTGALNVGDEFNFSEAMLYNDGTETKKIVFKFHVTVTEMPSVTLLDSNTEYERTEGFCNVTLSRSLPTGKWLTFCAPFSIGAGDWESMGISEVRRLGSVTKKDTGGITLNFTEETEGIWIGIPYIIKMSEAKTGLTKSEVGYDVCTSQPTTNVESQDGTVTVQFIGTYVKMALPNNVYYIQDDLFRYTNYTGTAVTNMKGFRGYFTITDTSSEVKELNMTFDDEEVVPTAIDGMDIVVNDRVDVYTLTGVKVKSGVQRLTATESLPSGIYIIGGKKQFVK